jgi:hypothetical protein
MKKDDRKKQKKRIKDRAKEAERRKYFAAKAARDLLPKILINPTGGDPELVRNIKRIVPALDLASLNNPHVQNFLQLIKREGKAGITNIVRSFIEDPDDLLGVKQLADSVLHSIGQMIFEKLPQPFREKPLPFYFFDVQVFGNTLNVTFDFLPTKKDDHGWVYLPPQDTETWLDGHKFQVGFARHAIEQACDRMTMIHPITFHEFHYCKLYFTHCRRYEGLPWSEGGYAFALYNSVGLPEHGIYDVFVNKIYQQPIDEPRRLYYLMGYCPVNIRFGRAVARTFLPPGYSGTPEDRLVRTASIDQSLRRQLLDAARDNDFERVLGGNHSVNKWYHDNGVPQVKEMPSGMFHSSNLF